MSFCIFVVICDWGECVVFGSLWCFYVFNFVCMCKNKFFLLYGVFDLMGFYVLDIFELVKEMNVWWMYFGFCLLMDGICLMILERNVVDLGVECVWRRMGVLGGDEFGFFYVLKKMWGYIWSDLKGKFEYVCLYDMNFLII